MGIPICDSEEDTEDTEETIFYLFFCVCFNTEVCKIKFFHPCTLS